MNPAYWHVALPSAPFTTLTYTEPEYLPTSVWGAGMRVVVPVGGSTRMGILVKRFTERPADLPESVALKTLLWPVEREALLSADYMALAENLAARQMEHTGRVLEILLPSGVRAVTFSFRLYDKRFPARLTPKALRGLSPDDLRILAALWADGRMTVAATKRHEKQQEFCSLAQDPPWPIRPTAKRQMEICEYLWDNGPTARPMLSRELGAGATQPLNTLISNGLVTVGPPPEFHEPEVCVLEPEDHLVDGDGAPEATDEQALALDDLAAALSDDTPQVRLVHGVTGSGKTLVYLRLAEQAVAGGRSVLLLAPEVALACSLYRAATQHFPGRSVRLYHGYQQPSRREQAFMEVAASTGPEIIVGTRSALFLPVADPAFIVLDEEHDGSFKQEERLAYQAKEVAHFLVSRSGGLLVLGSATPDVKTYQAVEQGAISKVCMSTRVGGNELPPVEFVDLRESPPDEGPFAPISAELLKSTVARGEQAVIMLNRRGYAPVMYCLDCGKVARCSNCDVGLTYHKSRERLVCHYCGAAEPFPRLCECGGASYLPMGEGTENVEEALAHLLPPDAGVLRLDRDSTRRPGRMEAILADFAAGKAKVLVGTQMLSKGHHFPDVTLVIVVDGDLGLNVPDYRAAERMFQLMVQVSGRAGRGDKPGRVLIQTRNPEHYCWQYVKRVDYEGFFEKEVALRKKYSYPPFTHLALLRMNYPGDFAGGHQAIMDLVKILGSLGKELGIRVLGPAPSPIGLLRGRKRYQCLIKGGDWAAIRGLYAEVRKRLSPHSKIRVSLDLDPVNML
ncbi:replication restart helicase PriA [Desulfovibrio ferrophilus]|nr:primosomal protein N' [Desulfovibrio ferrophilus]